MNSEFVFISATCDAGQAVGLVWLWKVAGASVSPAVLDDLACIVGCK